jgi:hypothetical protein
MEMQTRIPQDFLQKFHSWYIDRSRSHQIKLGGFHLGHFSLSFIPQLGIRVYFQVEDRQKESIFLVY